MKGQLRLFENEERKVEDVFEKYIDYSDLGRTQAMERDLDILTDFVNKYGETMIPLLERHMKEKTND